MNKTAKTLTFIAAIAGLSSVTTDANAMITSVTGSGALSNSNRSITGVFELDAGSPPVGYTLTLDNLSAAGFSQINWNGAGDSEGSPNPGFEFDVAQNYNITDTWSATLSFDRAVISNWEQTVSDRSGANNGATKFTLNWNNSTDTPTISDPNNQLEDKSTSIGNATFGIAPNPGLGSTGNLGAVFNNNDTWAIEGVSATEIVITWNVDVTESSKPDIRKEWITINGSTFEAANIVPEPPGTAVPFEFSPTLGLLGVGSIFGLSRLRRSLAKKSLQ